MRLILAACLLLVPALATADNRTSDVQKMKTDDGARARKQNKNGVIDMGSESIEGTTGKGEGERIDIASFGKAASLISIRRDFIAEILKSAEDL